MGFYKFNDIEIENPETQIIDNELFKRVQQLREKGKILSPNLGGKHSKISNMDNHELSFGYNDDPEINEYLTEKASMPLCPRCNDNLNVIKNGVYKSNRYSELQRYYCRPCNYEFKFTPKVPNLMIECAHCGNSGNIIRNGVRINGKGKKYQMYKCKDCGRYFRKNIY